MIKVFSTLALLLSISLVLISGAYANAYQDELIKKAESGDLVAQCALAEEYDPDIKSGNGIKKDIKKSLFWYEKAAQNGVAEAQFNLALKYFIGKHVKKNMKRTLELLTMAYNQGDSAAAFKLGLIYDDGDGVRQNFKKAVEYYTIAANAGHSGAQFNLGLLYMNGNGVRQNKSTAKEWFGKACDNGEEKGCKNYRILNEHGIQ